MSGIPQAPQLTAEQIEQDILAVLKGGKGYYYHVIWSRVLGVNFRNSPKNDHFLRQTLESLVRRGQVDSLNGWYAMSKGEKAQETKIASS